MGCDYYINQFLRLEHPGGISYVELPSIRGYFCDCAWGMRDCDCDEHEVSYYHDPEYLELHAKVEAFMLKPRPETIIYTNGAFISETIQLKYQPLIDEKLQKIYRRNMKDIVRIVKFEIRYEPGECPEDYYLYFEDEVDEEEERPESES